MQLIKSNLKFIVRIYFRDRKDTEIKNNNNFSKFNYITWKNVSIENVLLEKRLLHNCSIHSS